MVCAPKRESVSVEIYKFSVTRLYCSAMNGIKTVHRVVEPLCNASRLSGRNEGGRGEEQQSRQAHKYDEEYDCSTILSRLIISPDGAN